MSLQGKWRIVELPGYEADYADLMGPAYILIEPGGGEFAFGCVTGAFRGKANANALEFVWEGNDEMDEVWGDASAELEPNGSLSGETRFHGGDEIPFIACPWPISSTAC